MVLLLVTLLFCDIILVVVVLVIIKLLKKQVLNENSRFVFLCTYLHAYHCLTSDSKSHYIQYGRIERSRLSFSHRSIINYRLTKKTSEELWKPGSNLYQPNNIQSRKSHIQEGRKCHGLYSPLPTPSPTWHSQKEVAQYSVPSFRMKGAEHNLFATIWSVCGLPERLVSVLSDSELREKCMVWISGTRSHGM